MTLASAIGSTQLFQRQIQVVVGNLDVSELDIAFNVKKTLKPTPNTAEIKIFNLSEDSLRQLQAYTDATPVKILVGYQGNLSQIYLGETRAAWTEYDKKGETVTTLTTGTNAKAKKLNKIFQPVGANTPPMTALQNIAQGLGIPIATVSQGAKNALLKKTTLHPKPAVLSGNAWQLLDDFCRSADLEWSIQDFGIQILDYSGILDGLAIELSADTGLVGSPTVDIKGIVTAKCLMIPDLRPGRKVSINSRFVQGGYRVEEAHYEGSNFGPDFYCVIKGRKY